MNLRQDCRGTTLIELIVVISVAGFLAFMAGVGLVIFFAKWNEMNLYSDLQIDAFNAIYKMKHGLIVESSQEADFLGIASADSITFSGQSGGMNNFTSIKCCQSTGEEAHKSDFVRFWWDVWDGEIKADYKYGQADEYGVVLFPEEHKDEIRVTRLIFQPISKYNSTQVVDDADKQIIRIILEAQIETSEDEVRKVKYTTTVALDIT